MMKFINLTPHVISIYKENGDIVNFEPSGDILRINEPPGLRQWFDGREAGVEVVVRRNFGNYDAVEVLDKPDLINWEQINNFYFDEVYIVSNPVAQFCKHPRICAPDNSPGSGVRDDKGNIIGVRRLCTYD